MQPRRAGADSTVKMITNGLDLRHPAAEGPPPPGRRLHLGGAGRRRRRRLHLRAGCYALLRACGSLEQRAPRPPAATCFGTCLAGHLKKVLGCSWHVFDRVSVSVCGLFCDVACAPRWRALLVVLSVGLPLRNPLGVSEGYRQPQHALRRTRSCTRTKTIYRENSL